MSKVLVIAAAAAGAGLMYWRLKRGCGCHEAAKPTLTAPPVGSSSPDVPAVKVTDTTGGGIVAKTVTDTSSTSSSSSSSGCTGCVMAARVRPLGDRAVS